MVETGLKMDSGGTSSSSKPESVFSQLDEFSLFVFALNLQQAGPLHLLDRDIVEPLKPQPVLFGNPVFVTTLRPLVYLHVYSYYPVESSWVWMLCNG